MSIQITLDEGKLPHIAYEQENGGKRGFYVHHDQLIAVIQAAADDRVIELNETLFMSPSFPNSTIKYAQKSDGSHHIYMIEDETSTDVKYHDSTFEAVPFPKMVFGFVVKGQGFVKGFCAVYKDKYLRDNTQLFRFPYSNVHADGELCYWTNELIKDLVQLQTFTYRWREVPNNDHLYVQASTNQLNKPLREVFDLSQHQPFDYDMLTPMNRTFDEWARSHIQ